MFKDITSLSKIFANYSYKKTYKATFTTGITQLHGIHVVDATYFLTSFNPSTKLEE